MIWHTAPCALQNPFDQLPTAQRTRDWAKSGGICDLFGFLLYIPTRGDGASCSIAGDDRPERHARHCKTARSNLPGDPDHRPARASLAWAAAHPLCAHAQAFERREKRPKAPSPLAARCCALGWGVPAGAGSHRVTAPGGGAAPWAAGMAGLSDRATRQPAAHADPEAEAHSKAHAAHTSREGPGGEYHSICFWQLWQCRRYGGAL